MGLRYRFLKSQNDVLVWMSGFPACIATYDTLKGLERVIADKRD